MTPDQQCFMAALETLVDSADRLTATEFRSGVLLLAVASLSNGYANFSHEEAGIICGTDKNATMRAHLIHLRDTGVLSDYSTNGTVRIKFAAYGGREMIVHRRRNSLAEPTNSLAEPTNSLAEPTVDESKDEKRALSQLLRALRSRDRALSQQLNRNFDDYPQNQPSMLVSQLDLTNPPDQSTNKLTTTASSTIDPVEEARSVSFLLDAGVWMKTAKQLAKIHPFELLRRAVGFWWANRRSLGGEFDERPGIVITWLTNLEETTIPETLPSEFMASALFRRHRAPAEITEEATVAVTLVDDESPGGDEIEYAIDDELWQVVEAALQLPDVAKKMWFAGAKLWRSGTRFRLSLDAFQTHQVQNQFRPMLRRTLAQATGLAMSEIQLEVCPHDSIER